MRGLRLPKPEEFTYPDQWRLYRHDLADYYGPWSLSKLKYTVHLQTVAELLDHAIKDRHSGLNILDVGCAQGIVTISLAERGHRAVGVDISLGFTVYARLKDDKRVADFVRANGSSLPFHSKVFDIVLLGEILEHVADPGHLIGEAKRVLKDAGYMLITTPNGKALTSSLPSYQDRGDSTALRERQYGPDAENHLFLFRPSELRMLLERHRMQVVEWKYGKTWLFNTLSFPIVGRLKPKAARLMDRFISTAPAGRWTAEGLFVLAKKRDVSEQ